MDNNNGKELSNLPSLEAKGKQADGSPEVRNVRSGGAVGVLPAEALVRESQIGGCGCDCGACGVGQQGVID